MESKQSLSMHEMMRIVHLQPFQRLHFASKQYKISLRKQPLRATSIQNGCPSSRLGVDMISRRVFKKEKVIVLSILLGLIRIEISIKKRDLEV